MCYRVGMDSVEVDSKSVICSPTRSVWVAISIIEESTDLCMLWFLHFESQLCVTSTTLFSTTSTKALSPTYMFCDYNYNYLDVFHNFGLLYRCACPSLHQE